MAIHHFMSEGADGDGIAVSSPLEVLLKIMLKRFEADDEKGAVEVAKFAAPYLHGKAPVGRPLGDLAEVPDEELDRFSGGGAQPPTADKG